MNIQHLILLIAWILYCSIHSILAASRIKGTLQASLGINDRTYRLIYNILALAGLAGILFFQFSIRSPNLLPSSVAIMIIGCILLIPGAGLMLVSIIKYFKQLSGLKDQAPVLERKGAHQYVRHPLYAGTFLFISGLFFFFPTLANLICVIIIIGYTLIAIRFEEKKLLNIFGDQYREYQESVPMIFPKFKT